MRSIAGDVIDMFLVQVTERHWNTSRWWREANTPKGAAVVCVKAARGGG